MTPATGSLFPILPRTRHRRRLDNGLRVLVAEVPGAEVVSTCLWYRYGARDESAEELGAAHFLEHMMFKGSPAYGPGEVDRRTQALGGANNAFTGHDATVYYFMFSPPHWREALAIEADRMRSLRLDPGEVESERRVILEELAMYEADPWDSLDQAVQSALHRDHPYGRPILGTRESLAGLGSNELGRIHRERYAPSGAVLVLAGGVDQAALDEVESVFGGVEAGGVSRTPPPPTGRSADPGRIDRRRGRVARLIRASVAPAMGQSDYAALRLAAAILGSGRSSRLHHRLVEERSLCQWVSLDLTETEGPGTLTLAAELHPGVDSAEVEALVREEIGRLEREDVDASELDRARNLVTSGWVFGHDRVHEVGLTLGFGMALFEDEDFVEDRLRDLSKVTVPEVRAVATRWLTGDAVVGWSLPEVVPETGEASD